MEETTVAEPSNVGLRNRVSASDETDQTLLESCRKTLNWAKQKDYAGYSKFDALNSPLLRALSFNNRFIRLAFMTLISRTPINVRPLIGTSQSRNPKGIGLFALAYLQLYAAYGQTADLAEARTLLSWLDDNAASGYSGKCWGYDHAWQSMHFYAPKYSPNIVVTGNIVYAFLTAYEITKEPHYLEIARSSVEFMLKDLATPIETPTMRNIGYVPGSQWGVLNINGLAATILSWVWQHTGEPHLKQEARRLITFLVDKQTDYGAWHYAWPQQTSNVKHDNYHTGNVLDWVLEYSVRSQDETFLPNFKQGLDFYQKHLFLPNGAPKWMSHKTFPHDSHGSAQGIVTFSKAALHVDPKHLAWAEQIASWVINNMQHPDGYYYYQIGKFHTKRYTLMRWCNAWMAYGLGTLLLTQQRLRKQEL